MKPELKKRLWILAVALSAWLSSLFIYQTIVADPRHELGGVWPVEFFVCAFALMFAVAALILHARKSAIRLITSLVLLGVSTFCLLNTRTAAFFMYKDSASANITVRLDGVGPVQIGFGDFNSDSEFFPSVKIESQDGIANVKEVRVIATYNDLLGRSVHSRAEGNGADPDKGYWWFKLPPCFSGKELTVSIYITTKDGKVHEETVTVKVPKKPIWSS